MQNSAIANAPASSSAPSRGSTWHIVSFTYFTFVCYLSIGLPLAVLPPYVHFRMGFSATLAGLVVSIQYIATLASRPWAGRTFSGALLVAASALHRAPWLSLSTLILSRLVLGVGESLGSTGSTLWGITSAGPQHTAKVISFNGISTYGAMALGAPLGVVLDQQWGLASLGLLTILIGAGSFVLAGRKSPVHGAPGEHLPFSHVLVRVVPHGMGLALGGVGYSVLATFVTLFYLSRHWSGAALCLTAFGLAFIAARLLFIRTIDRFGGFPVGMACLAVESLGILLLWLAPWPWVAFTGAAITGFGFSLVFPALGVEAVKRVTESNRGAALGVYTAFADVSFFLTGPLAGAVIGVFGYRSAFLFALVSVLCGLGIVIVLRQLENR
jgi:MFS family permease